MYVEEIYNELKGPEVLGTCDEPTIFARLTDAVSLISDQGTFDPLIGEMDLCVCDGCVTLPAEVETVLGVNQAGMPTIIRDEWYQYHINGGGTTCYGSWAYTDNLGYFSTFKDPSSPVALIAEVESSRDNQKTLRVYGWDEDGKRIYTPNANGELEDGFLVPTVYGFSQPNPNAPLISRIDRVQKAVTNGFIKLIAVNSDGSTHTLIGNYLPYETNPRYVRIRVPDRNWLRIKYKKKNFQIRSQRDWINIDSREALIMAVKSVFFRRKGQIGPAREMEGEAIRILNNHIQSKLPPSPREPQIIYNEYPKDTDTLFY